MYFVFVFVCWCHFQLLKINKLTLMSLTESSLGSLRRFIESFEERLFSLLSWGVRGLGWRGGWCNPLKRFGLAWSSLATLERRNLGLYYWIILFGITDKVTQVGHHDFCNTNKRLPLAHNSQIIHEYGKGKKCVTSCRLPGKLLGNLSKTF